CGAAGKGGKDTAAGARGFASWDRGGGDPPAAVQRVACGIRNGLPRGRGDGMTGALELNATTVSPAEHTRRDFLYIATGAVAAVGAAATAWPFISQMNPDASTIAAGAPIDVDLAPIAEGPVIKAF